MYTTQFTLAIMEHEEEHEWTALVVMSFNIKITVQIFALW